MKLRIHDNSIRLRVSRTEVKRLARGEAIEGQTDLVPERLSYRLEVLEDFHEPAATFQAGLLTITLPLLLAERWADNEDVAIEASMPTLNRSGEEVRLLIEKDFQCMHGSADENADCFVNPLFVTEKAS